MQRNQNRLLLKLYRLLYLCISELSFARLDFIFFLKFISHGTVALHCGGEGRLYTLALHEFCRICYLR